MKNQNVLILAAVTILSSCAIIRPGEVGVKQKTRTFVGKSSY